MVLFVAWLLSVCSLLRHWGHEFVELNRHSQQYVFFVTYMGDALPFLQDIIKVIK
jgi:hypothetical protein